MMKKESVPHRLLTLTVLLAVASAMAACAPPAPPPEETAEEQPEPAEGPLPLPKFEPCPSNDHPVLPAKWQAVALMQKFVEDSIIFGNFVFDESVGAFRSTLANRYGFDLDLLVTDDRRIFLLLGGETPSGCFLVSNESPFTVPPRDWLTSGASCVGQAPILERDQEWWKAPTGEVGANWYWYNSADRLPFRTMFYERDPLSDPAPIYEQFTFNYFPTFEEVPATDLGEILELCEGSAESLAGAEATQTLDVFAQVRAAGITTPDADSIARIQSWIPGLGECSSPGSLPPPWPEQTQASVMMTAVSAAPNPFPTRVYYDWARDPHAQNSSLYNLYSEGVDPSLDYYVEEALLTGVAGYDIYRDKDGTLIKCEQSLPGPQVPDWFEVDGCECRAEIAPGTVLNPSAEPTKILWCPTDLSADQVFWTWYSDTGTPVVFMQTNSSPTAGTGLNLADYYGWSPGSIAPEGSFDIPEECPQPDPQPGLCAGVVPLACCNCHMPVNEPGGG